jgi:hypothetical protein
MTDGLSASRTVICDHSSMQHSQVESAVSSGCMRHGSNGIYIDGVASFKCDA